jgi:hypothetical protein
MCGHVNALPAAAGGMGYHKAVGIDKMKQICMTLHVSIQPDVAFHAC